MTHQSPAQQKPLPVEAGRQVAQLRSVLMLVEQMAGRAARTPGEDALLDESARLSSAFDHALPVVQRRFEALAAETAAWAASGVEALLAHQDAAAPPRTAAAALAVELDGALLDLSRLLRA
jgi:hypothetical protein